MQTFFSFCQPLEEVLNFSLKRSLTIVSLYMQNKGWKHYLFWLLIQFIFSPDIPFKFMLWIEAKSFVENSFFCFFCHFESTCVGKKVQRRQSLQFLVLTVSKTKPTCQLKHSLFVFKHSIRLKVNLEKQIFKVEDSKINIILF